MIGTFQVLLSLRLAAFCLCAILGIGFFHSVSSADVTNRLSFEHCVFMARELNKSYPSSVDPITRVLGVACLEEGGGLVLSYLLEVSQLGKTRKENDLKGLVPRMQNMWCSDSRNKALLQRIDIQYRYMDSEGLFIGALDININDCPRSETRL